MRTITILTAFLLCATSHAKVSNLWVAFEDSLASEYKSQGSIGLDHQGSLPIKTIELLNLGAHADAIDSAFQTAQINGRQFELFSLYFDTEVNGPDFVVETLANLQQAHGESAMLLGVWDFESGDCVRAIHPATWRFIPTAQSNIDLRDLNLVAGQAPRNFSCPGTPMYGFPYAEIAYQDSSVTIVNAEHRQWHIYGSVQATRSVLDTESEGILVADDIPRIFSVADPFGADSILPDHLPASRVNEEALSITATRGEYEPASFVIRSGEHDLRNIRIRADNLVSPSSEIDAESLNFRVVKTWFQSHTVMRRNADIDSQRKQRVPELLLHDERLILTDSASETNIVRSQPPIKDADSLAAFSVSANQNQQVWITAKIPNDSEPGVYAGSIFIEGDYNGAPWSTSVPISIEVLDFRLLQPRETIGLFYLSRLRGSGFTPGPQLTARSKTAVQMEAELKDMYEHGVRILTLDHQFSADTFPYNTLRDQLKVFTDSPFGVSEQMYTDFEMTHRDDAQRYANKMMDVGAAFRDAGINKYWVYNQDESTIEDYLRIRHTFAAAHSEGAVNAVAVALPSEVNRAAQLTGLLDHIIVQHKTPMTNVKQLDVDGLAPFAYGLPHAGEERPQQTRRVYGFDLARKGYRGVFSYAYQVGFVYDDWENWTTNNFRPNVLAYPTIDRPIPTLQWEAWREGVDDLRYLATYLDLLGVSESALAADVDTIRELLASTTNSQDLRRHLIEKIVQERQ